MKKIVLLGVMMCMLSRCYAQGAAPRQSADSSLVIPFTLSAEGEISVTLQFPNQPSAAFLVDTGWPDSTFTTAGAKRLGLSVRTRRFNPANPLQKLRSLERTTTVPKLTLGSLTLSDVPFIVESRIAVPEEDAENYEGVLGDDFFAHYAVFFDFDRRELRLWKNGGLSLAQRKQIGMETAFSTRLTTELTRPGYHVPVRFPGGEKTELVLDTGSAFTLLSDIFARKVGVELQGVYTLDDVSGEISGWIGSVKTLRIADFAVQDMPVKITSDDHVQPMLGRDFLLQHQLLIDFPHKMLFFMPRSQQAAVLPWPPSPLDIPLLEVTLSDGKPHRFGLDTSYDCALVKELAERLAAAVPASHLVKGKDDETLHSHVSLPGTSLVDANAFFNVKDANPLGPGIPVMEGELGENVLQQCALRLNFSHRRLEWITPGHLAGTTYVTEKMVRLPLLETDNGFVIKGQVNGKEVVFAFDLTSDVTTLKSPALAAAVKSRASQAPADTSGATVHLGILTLGGLTTQNIRVQDVSKAEKADTKAGEKSLEPAVVLGLDFLRRFEVIFDFAGGALYLTADPDFKESPK